MKVKNFRRELAGLLLGIVLLALGLFRIFGDDSDASDSTTQSDVVETTGADVVTPVNEENSMRNIDPSLPQAAGLYELESGPHTYTLYLPDGFDSAETYPLIVSLHYAGYNGPHYGRGLIEATLIEGFSTLNPIIIAPDSQSWSSDIGKQSAVAAINVALDNYNVDRERVLLTGYSMGGGGTWFLGAQMQDLFTALMPMAAFPRENSAEISWTIPIIALNSTADELFDFAEGERQINAVAAAGADVTLVTVDNISHYRAEQFAKPIQDALPLLLEKWQ